ncbi:MAG TPA: PKD domain-containing protein, partial [Acidimicrobiales bacterium]|nr:PKD domain-containing protein [Acidimicrobiales bacterium]
ASDYSATVNWGDGTTTVQAVTASGSTFVVPAAHQYSEDGFYPVSVVISDHGATLTLNGIWTVADAPVAGQASAVNASEGSAFAGQVASFTDGNPSSTKADFAATINWGDGHNSIGTVNGSAGHFTVSGTNTYGEEGSPTITVRVTDAGGNSTVITGPATVVDAPLHAGTFSLKAGSNSSTAVMSLAFTDSDPSGLTSDYTVLVNWGDGTTSTGTVSSVTGGFLAGGSHTYKAKGTYAVAVTVTDGGGASTSASGTFVRK